MTIEPAETLESLTERDFREWASLDYTTQDSESVRDRKPQTVRAKPLRHGGRQRRRRHYDSRICLWDNFSEQ